MEMVKWEEKCPPERVKIMQKTTQKHIGREMCRLKMLICFVHPLKSEIFSSDIFMQGGTIH
jgi:hypothetical protein